jgi:two-component system, LytTR family, response regulator
MAETHRAPDAPLRVLVVDDEAPARRGLRGILARHAEVEIVGEAGSGREAIAATESLSPDVVFLDIQMPDGDGFDVVRALGTTRTPAIVFCTAYDEFAVRAFEAHALDYLLKPIAPARVAEALQRVHRQRADGALSAGLHRLLAQVEARDRYRQRFVVRDGARAQFVPVPAIDWIESDGNYVRLISGTQQWLVRETLSHVESVLDPSRFLRVHRSLIVQLARVTQVESMPSGEFVLTLASGRRLTSGRTYRAAVQVAFGL